MKLILASASPRRREILTNAGYEYETRVSDIDESAFASLEPESMVRELAKAKALFVAKSETDCVVLGSDTVVALDGAVLGKPQNERHAKQMLRSLSGKRHVVYTGVCAVLNGSCETLSSMTEVEFFPLTDEEIDRYVATGEPFDKAGAYGIQGLGCTLVRKIDGDYFTVMGLPIALTARLLSSFGVTGAIIK